MSLPRRSSQGNVVDDELAKQQPARTMRPCQPRTPHDDSYFILSFISLFHSFCVEDLSLLISSLPLKTSPLGPSESPACENRPHIATFNKPSALIKMQVGFIHSLWAKSLYGSTLTRTWAAYRPDVVTSTNSLTHSLGETNTLKLTFLFSLFPGSQRTRRLFDFFFYYFFLFFVPPILNFIILHRQQSGRLASDNGNIPRVPFTQRLQEKKTVRATKRRHRDVHA